MRKQLQYTVSITMKDDWSDSCTISDGRRKVAEGAVYRAIMKDIMDPVRNNGFQFERVAISPPVWFDCEEEK